MTVYTHAFDRATFILVLSSLWQSTLDNHPRLRAVIPTTALWSDDLCADVDSYNLDVIDPFEPEPSKEGHYQKRVPEELQGLMDAATRPRQLSHDEWVAFEVAAKFTLAAFKEATIKPAEAIAEGK